MKISRAVLRGTSIGAILPGLEALQTYLPIVSAYPAALPGAILALILVGGFSVYWYRKLEGEEVG